MRLFTIAVIATLGMVATSADAQQDAGSPCARLAPQLGLKQQPVKRGSNEPAIWRVNMLGGVGAALFGGSFGATFSVEPVEGAPPPPGGSFADTCSQAGGNMTCRLVGPVRIKIGTKNGEASTDLIAGEHAQIGTEGRHLVCRDA